jgi:PAS domain S-box-containing protein
MPELSLWPPGNSLTADLIRRTPWAKTSLGETQAWPHSLRVMVGTLLACSFPMVVLWGPDFVQIYNDAYGEMIGDKHPDAMGQRSSITWREVWHLSEPKFHEVLSGKTISYDNIMFRLARRGYLEDSFFNVCFSPLRDDEQLIAGVLVTAFETTSLVRTVNTLHEGEVPSHEFLPPYALTSLKTEASGLVTVDSPGWRIHTGQTLELWLGSGSLDAIHPDDRQTVERAWQESIAGNRNVDVEFRLRQVAGGSGAYRWTNMLATPLRDHDGTVARWIGLNVDIEERKRVEATLLAGEERQAFLLRLSDLLRPVADPTEIQTIAMRMLGEHLGVDRALYYRAARESGGWVHYVDSDWYRSPHTPSLVGRHELATFGGSIFSNLPHGETVVAQNLSSLSCLTAEQHEAYRAVNCAAYILVPLIKAGLYVGGLSLQCSVSRNWTQEEVDLASEVAQRTWSAVERARAQDAMRASLAEKESLLSEVHHRVKNNLQVITSLLNLQSRGMTDDHVRALFNEARNRVQSIASIHESLYRSSNFAHVDLVAYARQLVSGLVRFYGAHHRVQVHVEASGAAWLVLERAVPFGLLLNELVSNALKHGLTDPATGTLSVTLRGADDIISLEVKDSGPGLPENFQVEQGSSLGLKLVHLLVRQLNGTLRFRVDAGTAVLVDIPMNAGTQIDGQFIPKVQQDTGC